MRPAYSLSVAVLSFSVACAEMPSETPNESTETSELVSANRVGLNRVGLNRVGLNRVGLNRVGLNRIGLHHLQVNLSSAGDLLATDDGREVFSLAMSCALDGDTTLVATIDGTDYEFPGEMGLATSWLSKPLDDAGQGWVSACMFARANAHEVVIPISMRGDHKGLETDRDERESFPLEEGAFFGNIFGPTDQPIPWYACRGRAQAKGEYGGLIDRDCAEPDPANPGYTVCGLIYAGDCGTFARNAACERFSERGKYYDRCHEPSTHVPRRAEAGRDCGPGGGHHDDVSRQVITTYVTL